MGCGQLKCSLKKSTLSEESPTPRIASTKINLKPLIVYFLIEVGLCHYLISEKSVTETVGMERSLFFLLELWLGAAGTHTSLGSPPYFRWRV